jgi:hypothetical protein
MNIELTRGKKKMKCLLSLIRKQDLKDNESRPCVLSALINGEETKHKLTVLVGFFFFLNIYLQSWLDHWNSDYFNDNFACPDGKNFKYITWATINGKEWKPFHLLSHLD